MLKFGLLGKKKADGPVKVYVYYKGIPVTRNGVPLVHTKG